MLAFPDTGQAAGNQGRAIVRTAHRLPQCKTVQLKLSQAHNTACCTPPLPPRSCSPPLGVRERIYNYEGLSAVHFDPKPCEADTMWINVF